MCLRPRQQNDAGRGKVPLAPARPVQYHAVSPERAERNRRVSPLVKSILLLCCSNVFMTFAWYAHLKELNHKPWFVAALASFFVFRDRLASG